MTKLQPGTFTPAPARASTTSMALSQGKIESKLMLRHGEQQLLSMIIPVVMLIVATSMPVLGEETSLDEIFAMILAIAASSSGFTGQAIQLAFDRRYGALKRSGASGVSGPTIILGKVLAVVSMVILQVTVLTIIALLMGWRTGFIGTIFGLVTLVLGVAAFSCLGLLMGGTLSSELVLGLANLLWIVLAGAVGWVLYQHGLSDAGWYNLIPTVALASGINESFMGTIPLTQLVVLVGWGIAGALAATKWFRFEA